MSTRTQPPPVALRVLAACVGIEGLALVAVGAVLAGDVVVHVASAAVRSTLLFAVLAALFVLYGGTLLLAARAALRRRRWARALALLSQVLGLLMGWQIAAWGLWQVGVPLLAVGAVGFVLALAPRAGGLLVEPGNAGG